MGLAAINQSRTITCQQKHKPQITVAAGIAVNPRKHFSPFAKAALLHKSNSHSEAKVVLKYSNNLW